MKVTIEVSDERFEALTRGELDALNKEELTEVVRDGILTTLKDSDVLQKILTTETRYYDYIYASDVLKKAVEKLDLSPIYKDVSEKVVKYIEENFASLATDIFSQIFFNGFASSITTSGKFKDEVCFIVQREITHHFMNDHSK